MTTGQFRFTFRSNEGDEALVEPHFVRPFDAETLLESDDGQCLGLDLEMQSRGMTLNEERHEELFDVRARVQFPEALTVFSLVRGGWLPMPFTIPPRFLVDRNVVIQLRRIREGGNVPNSQALLWWTRLFEEGSAMFNPLPYAFEGAYRRKPTKAEFVQAFDEGSAEIEQALPACHVIRYNEQNYDAAYDQLEAFDRRAAREIAFLVAVAPMIAQRPSEAQLWTTAREVLNLADRHQIQKGSMPTLAALSCVFEDQQGSVRSIGRALLKPSATYTEADAFNGLSDIRHIEMTSAGQTHFGAESFAFCTCDRGVARFWSALALRGVPGEGDVIENTFDLGTDMFSRLDQAGILRLRDELSR